MGVDQIFVDEADLYKNLAYSTKMTRIAGLPNSDSNRAFDMYIKMRYLQERQWRAGRCFRHRHAHLEHAGRDVHDASLSRAGDAGERGVKHFDAWAANFAEAVTSLELAPDGSGYRMHTRFAKFINLPELLSDVSSVRGRADGGHAASSATGTYNTET